MGRGLLVLFHFRTSDSDSAGGERRGEASEPSWEWSELHKEEERCCCLPNVNLGAAGNAFCQAAQLHLQLQSKHDAATCFVDAGNAFKKADPQDWPVVPQQLGISRIGLSDHTVGLRPGKRLRSSLVTGRAIELTWLAALGPSGLHG
ncbi:hypothetical protein P7K49_034699 [Saguinus oedipus]|uniref:Uncharacterized protein n=1 Tax=Saguinus oedipus TaxID=9490 RepID=A0ABQ9TX89_SAGOE|nr:hypothetical protein P7K49_034699 [Saguinus oedipus]